MDTKKDANKAAALEDEANLVLNEADILLFNARHMKSPSNYIVERLLKAVYKQGWRILTQWERYPIFDATRQPLKAFVYKDGKLIEVFVQLVLTGAPKCDTVIQAARKLMSKIKEAVVTTSWRRS